MVLGSMPKGIAFSIPISNYCSYTHSYVAYLTKAVKQAFLIVNLRIKVRWNAFNKSFISNMLTILISETFKYWVLIHLLLVMIALYNHANSVELKFRRYFA